jgi:hypothetical protein
VRRLELLRALPARLLLELRLDALLVRDDLLLVDAADRREAERRRDVDRLLLDLLVVPARPLPVVPARRRPVVLARFLPTVLRDVDFLDEREAPALRLLLPRRLRVPDERLRVCAISYSKPLRVRTSANITVARFASRPSLLRPSDAIAGQRVVDNLNRACFFSRTSMLFAFAQTVAYSFPQTLVCPHVCTTFAFFPSKDEMRIARTSHRGTCSCITL